MPWYDFMRLWTWASTQDPYAKKRDTKQLPSAGTTQPDVDIRGNDPYSSGTTSFIRIQNDLVDMTTTTNRGNRYKEYDRLLASCPEIEMAMTVIADEACVVGETDIATVYHGYKTIEWLARNLS